MSIEIECNECMEFLCDGTVAESAAWLTRHTHDERSLCGCENADIAVSPNAQGVYHAQCMTCGASAPLSPGLNPLRPVTNVPVIKYSAAGLVVGDYTFDPYWIRDDIRVARVAETGDRYDVTVTFVTDRFIAEWEQPK